MKNLKYLFWLSFFSISTAACLKLDPIPPKPVLNITEGPSVTDIEGNQYNTVVINTQTWTTSNLKVSKYRNGDTIPQVQDSIMWKSLTSGAWCYYNNKATNDSIYGKLYNWYAINDIRGIAPEGYHIPSNAEWKEMTSYLGDQSLVGVKLKATSGWGIGGIEGNGSNSGKFSGLPGGTRKETAKFDYLLFYGYWWTSSSVDSTTELGQDAWSRQLSYDDDILSSWEDSKKRGFSLRCIKDK